MGGKSKKGGDAGYFFLAVVVIIASPFILAYYVLKWIFGGIFNGLGLFFDFNSTAAVFVIPIVFILIVFGVYYAISQRNR